MFTVRKSRQEQSISRGLDPCALPVPGTTIRLGVMGDPQDLGEWQWQTRREML